MKSASDHRFWTAIEFLRIVRFFGKNSEHAFGDSIMAKYQIKILRWVWINNQDKVIGCRAERPWYIPMYSTSAGQSRKDKIHDSDLDNRRRRILVSSNTNAGWRKCDWRNRDSEKKFLRTKTYFYAMLTHGTFDIRNVNYSAAIDEDSWFDWQPVKLQKCLPPIRGVEGLYVLEATKSSICLSEEKCRKYLFGLGQNGERWKMNEPTDPSDR